MSWSMTKKYSDKERWLHVYPAYINSKKTVAQGRCIEIHKCVENPTCEEIKMVLQAAGFKACVEKEIYPREQNKDDAKFRGCVRFQLKNDDGTPVKPELPTKRYVLGFLGGKIAMLESRKIRQNMQDKSQNSEGKNKGKNKKKGSHYH